MFKRKIDLKNGSVYAINLVAFVSEEEIAQIVQKRLINTSVDRLTRREVWNIVKTYLEKSLLHPVTSENIEPQLQAKIKRILEAN